MKIKKWFLCVITLITISCGMLFAQTATDKLFEALEKDTDIQTVKDLIGAGADVNARKGSWGWTVLMLAIEHNEIGRAHV